MPGEPEQARKKSGLSDKSVFVYESEIRILYCLIRAFISEKYGAELERLVAVYEAASENEELEFIKELSDNSVR